VPIDERNAKMFARSDHACFVAAPSSPDADALETAWTYAVQNGYSREVVKAVKEIDPSIASLQLLLTDNTPVLVAESDIGAARLNVWPVAVGGSGFKRLLTLVAQLSGATGVVCVDDPDAFLHPKIFTQLARLFWGLVRNGAQVVVATHNPDLIDVLAREMNGPPDTDLFGVYGFKRDAQGVLSCALRLTGAAAQNPKRMDAIRELLGI
jgi:hypothetical protein